MPFLTLGQWRWLVFFGVVLLLVTGWGFANGAMPWHAHRQPIVVETPCPTYPQDPPAVEAEPTAMDGTKADGTETDVTKTGRMEGGPGAEDGVDGTPVDEDGRLDINRADVEAFQRLPGIGPVLAARIVAYRDQWGPFQHPSDLLEVSGIGPRTFEAIQDYIRVGER